jgi:manganese/iron transport system ATP-binding protein
MAAETLLGVSAVAVELSGRRVLHDVNLELHGGELVGLIGPNGAGKTTLLRAILAAVAVRAGHIEVLGVTPQRARGTVGYVPQRHEFAWDFPISVHQAVLSGRVHRIGRLRRAGRHHHDAVTEALERVDLTTLRRRPIGELSGGQRQRVLVARALALQPRLLLLDEPFTGLDAATQALLTHLLGQLRDEGHGVLMTTHDIRAAVTLCDRLCLLNRTVVADGPPGELRSADLWLRALGVTGGALLSGTDEATAPMASAAAGSGTGPAARSAPAGAAG